MNILTAKHRAILRATAHTLNPVVSIGEGGVTPGVIRETGVALDAHELVKIRVHSADRAARANLLDILCQATGAVPVQHIGRILVLYRPANPPRIVLT
ncbi:MAG TPA: YhbY family RNA-binding protein [Burkholderiales bacterium]|nr:YhbY family RNA-binding protein [Burkholderiales bacterium]